MFGTRTLTQAASDLNSIKGATLCVGPSEGAGDWMVYRYCKSEREAEALCREVQSIGGSRMEQAEDFVYCLPLTGFYEITHELQEGGFDWEEVG